MTRFLFWQRWLLLAGLTLTAFGLALAFFSQTWLFDALFNNQVNPVFWSAAAVSPATQRFQAWAYGVLGATIAGWGIVTAFLARYPFRNKEPWAWTAIALAISVWFITDTGLSVWFGVTFNAVFNILVLLLVLLPLNFTRSDFHDRRA